MGMDLSQLFAPTLVFMMACYFAAFGIRRMCELRWPRLTEKLDWADIVLPCLPVLLGVAFALIPKIPLPPAFVASFNAKVEFGFVAGAVSSWGYRIAKAVIKRLFGVDVDAPMTVVATRTTTVATVTDRVHCTVVSPTDGKNP